MLNQKRNIMKKRAPVSTIMTANPISVTNQNTLSEVARIFHDNTISHLPVVEGDKLVGMVSKTDIDRVSFVLDSTQDEANTAIYNTLSLEQVMTKQLDVIKADDQIKEAAELLARGKYHALPVVKDEKLAGIVTSTDVINYLLEQY